MAEESRRGIDELWGGAQTELDGLGFDAARVETLEATVTTENLAVRELQERVDELSSQLSRVRFDYKDPEKGFDRAKVKGVVAKLLRVKEPAAATALEVLAGGKLYQVTFNMACSVQRGSTAAAASLSAAPCPLASSGRRCGSTCPAPQFFRHSFLVPLGTRIVLRPKTCLHPGPALASTTKKCGAGQ